MSVDKARVDIGFFSLSDLIRTAWKLKSFQVTGPDWLSGQRFDILAKMPDGATEEQVPEMLQQLLVERFKLEFHHSSKEQSVYALIVAKGGHKMKDAVPDADKPATEEEQKSGQTLTTNNGQMTINVNKEGQGATIRAGNSGAMKMSMQNGAMHMEFKKFSMAQLSEMLSRFADKPVVDLTELKGNYEVGIDLSPEDMRNAMRAANMAGMGMGMMAPPAGMGGGPGGPGGPGGAGGAGAAEATEPSATIFSSVAQMGLKLEARKTPVEIMVVDKAEKMPIEN
jgi:uncharacterized protein (TIGR03435 family)